MTTNEHKGIMREISTANHSHQFHYDSIGITGTAPDRNHLPTVEGCCRCCSSAWPNFLFLDTFTSDFAPNIFHRPSIATECLICAMIGFLKKKEQNTEDAGGIEAGRSLSQLPIHLAAIPHSRPLLSAFDSFFFITQSFSSGMDFCLTAISPFPFCRQSNLIVTYHRGCEPQQ